MAASITKHLAPARLIPGLLIMLAMPLQAEQAASTATQFSGQVNGLTWPRPARSAQSLCQPAKSAGLAPYCHTWQLMSKALLQTYKHASYTLKWQYFPARHKLVIRLNGIHKTRRFLQTRWHLAPVDKNLFQQARQNARNPLQWLLHHPRLLKNTRITRARGNFTLRGDIATDQLATRWPIFAHAGSVLGREHYALTARGRFRLNTARHQLSTQLELIAPETAALRFHTEAAVFAPLPVRPWLALLHSENGRITETTPDSGTRRPIPSISPQYASLEFTNNNLLDDIARLASGYNSNYAEKVMALPFSLYLRDKANQSSLKLARQLYTGLSYFVRKPHSLRVSARRSVTAESRHVTALWQQLDRLNHLQQRLARLAPRVDPLDDTAPVRQRYDKLYRKKQQATEQLFSSIERDFMIHLFINNQPYEYYQQCPRALRKQLQDCRNLRQSGTEGPSIGPLGQNVSDPGIFTVARPHFTC